MTDIETRLSRLRNSPQPAGADVSTLRRRAEHRARRRRTVIGVAAVAAVVLGTLGVLALDGNDPQRVETVPIGRPGEAERTSTTTAPQDDPGPVRSLGEVVDVTVEVSPRTGLTDGALVDVRIDGLAELPGAVILMCAGDIDAANASSSCDTSAIQRPDAEVSAPVPAEVSQIVSVARFLHISRDPTDPNRTEPYDCATEPAGCGIAVAPYSLPARGVVVPVSFRADALLQPRMVAGPTTGLSASTAVTVEADGLRPNGTFTMQQCRAGGTCDELVWTRAETDGSGRLTGVIIVHAALYTYEGRTDCTATDCTIQLRDPAGTTVAEAPVAFGAGVDAPMPLLTVEPDGPHVDDQEVEVRGTGFPPGIDVGPQLGQCPAHLDTSVEERCARPNAFSPVVVADDGTFTTRLRLSNSLLFTGSCVTGPGCVLAWVIPHGPIATSVPLTFEG